MLQLTSFIEIKIMPFPVGYQYNEMFVLTGGSHRYLIGLMSVFTRNIWKFSPLEVLNIIPVSSDLTEQKKDRKTLKCHLG